MRAKFKTLYHGFAILFLAILLCSIWVGAQTAPDSATNSPPAQKEKAVWPDFGLKDVTWLQNDLFKLGHPTWQYAASLIFIVLAFYLAKGVDWVANNRIKAWVARNPTSLDTLLIDLLHGPVKIITFVVVLHIGLRGFTWPEWVADYCSKFLHFIVGLSLTYVAIRCVDVLVAYWKERALVEGNESFDEMLFPAIRKCLKGFVILVGVLVTAQNLGLNITGALASLSIGGLAVGLAAQDTLSNLFGAIAIFVDKPFRINDRIKLDAVDGNVESIGLRSTRVRNLDGHLVTIPNKTMGNATITNISRRPNLKTEMNIGITYDLPPEKVKLAIAILEEIYRANPKTADLIVSFNKFGDSALNIMVVHWWGSTDFREYLAGMQAFNLEIKRRFDEAGIEFAFPSQTHYVKQLDK